jgi:hypothetical protein
MDVIGYDRVVATPAPEPSSAALLVTAFIVGGLVRRRRITA